MTETLTHAVTQPQPMAWALASGHCPVICSDTRPDIARIGELIGIHASAQRPDPAAHEHMGLVLPESLPRGALVGVARLVGVLQAKAGDPLRFWRLQGKSASVGEYLPEEESARIRPWAKPGAKWLLYFRDAVALPEPIPMRGAGGLWRLPRWAYPAEGEIRDGRGWALEQWRKGRATK